MVRPCRAEAAAASAGRVIPVAARTSFGRRRAAGSGGPGDRPGHAAEKASLPRGGVWRPDGMTFPTGAVLVPDVVRELAGEARVTAVWSNELGGRTFRVDPAEGPGPGTSYVKWAPYSER